MEKVRAHVMIEGRVQGVFFRHHTQEMAFKLRAKGVGQKPQGWYGRSGL